MTHTEKFRIDTRGRSDVLDITSRVSGAVRLSEARTGIAVAFVVGSTAAITTTEAEPGLMQHDLKAFFERIAPDDIPYQHEETWHDDNGHAHVRASAVGPSVAIPIVDVAAAAKLSPISGSIQSAVAGTAICPSSEYG